MICALCHGNRFVAQKEIDGHVRYEWWPCQACGGAGTRFLCSPPEIKKAKPK